MSFTAGELEVMKVLWAHGPLKPAQIQAHFGRPVRNETLRSALRVLLEKGHVKRTKAGKAYFYEASTPREGTFKRMTRKIADVFCGGSPATLIAQLIQSEKLSAEDIAELQRITHQKALDAGGKKNRAGEGGKS